MRRSAVASGSERRYTTSRTPASSGSPASASEPPMTMMLGLSRLTALASTSPIVRPASRTRPIASVEPARARATTSRLDPASMPSSLSSRATAAPEATASRQPTLPQRHTASTSWGTWMWPRSPAAPWAPRRSAPSLMIPQPIPVATLTNIRWSTSREAQEALAERHHVDVVVDDDVDAAQRLAHEAGDVEAVPAGHDRRVRRPAGGELDRPGQPDADADDVAEAATGAAHERPAVVDDPASTFSGPTAMSRSTTSSASTLAARSVDGQAHVGGADVGAEDDPRRAG